MLMPHRSYASTANYRFGFNGQEMSNEFKGLGNSYSAEYWEYDSRLGRRWNLDPIIKHNESPYATFSNNPISFIDPNGADTSKFLSNSQVVDAIKIGYNTVKAHVDNKTFSIATDYSKEIKEATLKYWEANQGSMNFGAFVEFQNQAIDYYKGFKEVAASVNGGSLLNDLGGKILNNSNVSSSQAIIASQKIINQKNGEFGTIAQQGVRVFPLIMSAALVSVGPGPRAPFSSNTQELIVTAGIPKVDFAGTRVSIYRGLNAENPLFQLKGGEYKYTGQGVRGLSVHVDAAKLTNARGASYQITQMPKELRIVQQGKDPGHFEIIPNTQMSQEKFQELLYQIKYIKSNN